MSPIKRTAAAAMSAALLAGTLAGPAAAATSSKHWSKSHCTTYVSSFHKSHKHATAAQKRTADKTLKAKGCTVKV